MQRSEQRPDVVVVGRACRLPGASSVDELWANLIEGRCSVTEIPDDRWSKAKHGHPRAKEPGKSYTWAAGVLDDIWGFDPSVFGISPREAEQMDPHQRLMLEVTWEALEDAGIRRSSVAGTDVGVFIGASSPEFSAMRSTDMAGGDAYTATGGALSIVSNRISHAFDLQGPSFTVDTACSSSLVALHQAMEALRSGRIDTAIVGGINLLLSPFGFVTFSQASMLSPTGRCQTFDAGADGYVRAEGAVVLVLKTAQKAARDEARVYARIAASGVNSDGRTNGIALPSRFSQAKLLREVYADADLKPSQIAFVEAHGTGTRVGDPIEAFTIGDVLGRDRDQPLKIGSIKSNIGHLEPASGLAGMLKAMLALEHDVLPASVNYQEPNPDIPFGDLNLEVCSAPTPIPRTNGPRYVGINSFGFGGTNAHVVISDPVAAPARAKRYSSQSDRLALSGATRPAVLDLARRYAERLSNASSEVVQEFAAAAAHRREMLAERAVVEWRSPRDLVRKLEQIADKTDDVPGVTWGTVTEPDAPVAFVFSGNGGQWPGMGRAVHGGNRVFREAFDEVDALFDGQFGWSITEALFANDLEQRLQFTHVAQPLIFAIQIATARALAAEGLVPAMVIGHSVGEIAAAAVAGALTLRDAVKVIHARSAHQELARDAGRMAVVVASEQQVEELAAEIGEIEIAAFNSPRTFTVAGPTDKIKALGARARKRRIVFRQLDLDYPFHCALIDPVREPLRRDLTGLSSSAPRIDMISTVTGELVEGAALGEDYWWRNVREPVRFAGAIEAAAHAGARVFVEIGPRSVLLSAVNETLQPTSLPFAAMGVLERREEQDEPDPIRPAVVNAFVRGARIETEKLFGPEPTRPVAIPSYGWQRRDFRPVLTLEAVGSTLDTRWHRLIGARNTHEGVEWMGQLDTAALPELADHDVGGQAILPGAAFIEIALSVARDWFETETAALLDIDIVQPLQLERDRAREVKARLSPSTNTLEILSRPRLSRGAWNLHATAKLTQGCPDPIEAIQPAATGKTYDADAVYRAAVSVGLNYGPEFRLARSVTRIGETRLVVDLAPSAPHGDYRIDPARLDACFHGLFVLFGELGAQKRGTAYLPVRFGHIRLTRPGASPASAMIDLRKVGERSIVADFTLFDAAGEAIASLHEARFQAARVRRPNVLEDRALSIGAVSADRGMLGRSGAPTAAAGILERADAIGVLVGADAEESSEQLLLEGWATAASHEIARGIDPSGTISPDFIAALPAQTGPWLVSLLHALEASELAEVTEGGWRLAADADLPASNAILRALAGEHPGRSSELLLASSLADLARNGASLADGDGHGPAGTTVDGFELAGASVRASSDLMLRLLDETGAFGPDAQGLRILQVGYGPLSGALKRAGAACGARLSILEPDARRLERAKLALGTSHDVAFLDGAARLVDGSYDLVVAAERLHRLGRAMSLSDLRRAIAPGGSLVAIEPIPSQFRDLALGLTPDWFDGGATSEFPVSPLRGEEPWRHELEGCGFDNVAAVPVRTGGGASILIVADATARETARSAIERVIRLQPAGGHESSDLAARLDAGLAADGHRLDRADEGERIGLPSQDVDTLVFLGRARPGLDDVAALRELCMELKAAVEACAGDKTDVWVVAEATGTLGALSDAVGVGLASFSRTLANETPGITVRRIAVAGGLDAGATADTIVSLLGAEQVETDILIERGGPRVLRVEPLHDRAVAESATAPAARLERGVAGLAGIVWAGIEAPPRAGPGEVEIAVEASGLNFRDVMWAMSLLPDDILEDGFAGPTLGLECAGRVTRVGAGVDRFKAGDRVIAFAPSAFATAVTVPQGVVAPIPAGVGTEAAASIPVAFLTAYYGLVTLAGLRRGEWVLIHGAAGGVGLAAIQIAQERGANIVATAGSREKRNLLHALGVEHVLNSRSSVFADDIRGICPQGVDVVLNSLAGEAMERGLSTLKPFGRFIELGKRDYVGNTKIGLRPFRRNLSYFGVDVDQLLSDRDRASEIFGEVIRGFEAGLYRPLPYRVYHDGEVVDAFRLMQQSGHIGKIVLRPPQKPVPMSEREEFLFDPDRTHVVTGGFGGFGLETAIWLADKGVRHLVLTGRKGAESEDAKSVVAQLQARGIDVLAAACDVADERALGALLGQVRRTMPPMAGIMHAAMVLEDGMLGGLTDDQLTRVLTPKVRGASLLDRMTAQDELDYFILFSSITTVVGNPGQAAYVAANGYLEGLARARREAGRPALALAWGAISDVGILARQKGLAEALAKRVGVKAMPAREALDLMAQALCRNPASPDEAVLAIGSLDWSAARRLPALASPTFAALVRDGVVVDGGDRASIDLRVLVATKDSEEVRKTVIEVIVEEIATVLRIPKQDVGSTKRLAEMGLDSLMAIELATALQERLELGSPPTGSVGSLTVPGLAENLISFVHSGSPDEDARVTQALNDRHAGVALDEAAMASVMEAVSAHGQTSKGVSQ